MSKKVAVIQSNFFPWRGYFKLISSVDEFVFYDSVQYTRRDWRNRNKIKMQNGPAWLTVPVQSKGNYYSKISEIKTLDSDWKRQHLSKIKNAYKPAPYFESVYELIKKIYSGPSVIGLSDFNIKIINEILEYLDINTKTIRLERNTDTEGKNKKLIEICKLLGASTYVSGTLAQSYIDEKEFQLQGLDVAWFDYGEAKVYKQLWGDFSPNLSIIDLLFNLGRSTKSYL